MLKPSVQTYLLRPGDAWRNISKCVDIESAYEIADAIESPSETNEFIAPDVQLKVHAGTLSGGEFQLDWLDGILPESTNFKIIIIANSAQVFSGFILPTSLQVNDVERWVSFTAIGNGAKLARWSAEHSALTRQVDPWFVKSAAGNAYRATVVIERALPQYSCEYLTDDIISVFTGGGGAAEVKVISVTPDGTTLPAASFSVIVEGMEQPFAGGSEVNLVTRFVRNVALQSVVNVLFTAAGLAAPTSGNYNVTPITGSTTQFATRPNLSGLLGVPLSLTASIGGLSFEYPIVGTTLGTFLQTNPPLGPWVQLPEYLQGTISIPFDWTDGTTLFSGMDFLLYGPREEGYPYTPTDPDSDQVYIKWRYWITSQAAVPPYRRFGLSVRVGNANGTGVDFPFFVDILRDESYDGITWSRTHTVSVAAGSTTTNLHEEVWEMCDIEVTGVRSSQARVIFTYPLSGDPVDYAIGHASPVDLSGLVTEYVTGVRGRFQAGCLFQSDSRRGNTPVARPYLVNESGVPVVWETPIPIPRGFSPHTFTMNRGDNLWYALAVNETDGVVLLSYLSNRLAPRDGWVPPQIEPPGTSPYVSLDLVGVRAGTSSGSWPMVAMVGTNIWWIAYSFSGIIPYADVEGLSCGEALAQLATTVDATFFVNANDESHFISRAMTSGKTIATGTGFTSTRIDDDGCLTIKRASIFYKSYRYARVENERDETVWGEAGSKDFIGSEQALEITNRFILTVSMARARAEHALSYLGRALQTLEIVHELDGRNYAIGRTLTAVMGGVLRTYQIIESTPRPIEGTVRLLALEM